MKEEGMRNGRMKEEGDQRLEGGEMTARQSTLKTKF